MMITIRSTLLLVLVLLFCAETVFGSGTSDSAKENEQKEDKSTGTYEMNFEDLTGQTHRLAMLAQDNQKNLLTKIADALKHDGVPVPKKIYLIHNGLLLNTDSDFWQDVNRRIDSTVQMAFKGKAHCKKFSSESKSDHFFVYLAPNETIFQLKTFIRHEFQEIYGSKRSLKEQRLISSNKTLENHRTIKSYNIIKEAESEYHNLECYQLEKVVLINKTGGMLVRKHGKDSDGDDILHIPVSKELEIYALAGKDTVQMLKHMISKRWKIAADEQIISYTPYGLISERKPRILIDNKSLLDQRVYAADGELFLEKKSTDSPIVESTSDDEIDYSKSGEEIVVSKSDEEIDESKSGEEIVVPKSYDEIVEPQSDDEIVDSESSESLVSQNNEIQSSKVERILFGISISAAVILLILLLLVFLCAGLDSGVKISRSAL
eukprot:792502_1